MKKEEHFEYGRILKTHGYKGGITIRPKLEYMAVELPDTLILEVSGSLIPFFVENRAQGNNGKRHISLEGISSMEAAKELVGNSIYLPLKALPSREEAGLNYHEIEGYRVCDKLHGDIGIVELVLRESVQSVMQVNKGEQEILIPLADPIILNVDRAKKLIEIDAPEGLIELYL